MSKNKKSTLSRRSFIQQGLAAAAVAGYATVNGGCATVNGGRRMASLGDDTYDYIVIGSGAGGGPVAVNLARAGEKAGYRVLILEAGGDPFDVSYDVPSFHPWATEDPGMSWNFFVNHYANAVQQQRDNKYVAGKGILYPRAGTLGGCTAHNAMISLCAANQDWDDIANLLNDPSWHSDNMRSYYERVERKRYGLGLIDALTQRRSRDGWLTEEMPDFDFLFKDDKICRIMASCLGGMTPQGLPELSLVHDPNDWSYLTARSEGPVLIPKATVDGHRTGTRELIKNALKIYPKNLFLRMNSLATRILFDQSGPTPKAVGVEYIPASHVYRADPNAKGSDQMVRQRVYATREVILAGGAFNSPQLLMLSGVGDREELSQHNIPVVANLPGVGKNLQDRYETGVVSKLKTDFSMLKACTFGAKGDPCLTNYYDSQAKHRIYTSNGPIIAKLARSSADKADPDLCLFALPGSFRGYYPGWSKDTFKTDHMTWAVLKGHTHNTSGTVGLKSGDPLDTPEINFNYFDAGTDPKGEDLQAVLRGIEMVRGFNETEWVKPMIAAHEFPPPSTKDLGQYVKDTSWGHHASCTNKMGPDKDPMAVVDGKFRVRGTTGLRIVDASVFPKLPGLFLVVPIYTIAEKASDDILADAAKY